VKVSAAAATASLLAFMYNYIIGLFLWVRVEEREKQGRNSKHAIAPFTPHAGNGRCPTQREFWGTKERWKIRSTIMYVLYYIYIYTS